MKKSFLEKAKLETKTSKNPNVAAIRDMIIGKLLPITTLKEYRLNGVKYLSILLAPSNRESPLIIAHRTNNISSNLLI
jgi:hypothetical protein